MIWHYHPGELRIAFAVEMLEGVTDNAGAFRATENAGAMTGIEPLLDRAGETLVILTFRLARPWLRMQAQPCVALILPLLEEMTRHGVGEAESDEINGAFLLPMRQAIFGMADIGIRIEEAQVLGIHGCWRGGF